jgi:radical SAM protein with 4Fe4S-binding SPASM domain
MTDNPELKKYPFVMQVGITGECNLRCIHCYDDADTHYHMSFQDCKRVVDAFLDYCSTFKRLPVIWLTGGEPTLHPHFWDILDYIEVKTSSACYTAVLSNGTTMSEDMVHHLEEYSMRMDVQISFDGATPQIHDAIRGKGAFQKALRALKYLSTSKIATHMHYVVHRNNYEDAFAITDLAVKMRADVLTVTRLVPWGRGKNLEKLMLTPEQVLTLYRKLSHDFDRLSADKMSNLHIARDRCDWPVIYDPSHPDALTKNGQRCSAGLSHICVVENGDVYPCRRMPVLLGNIFEEDFVSIWNHPMLWNLREKHHIVKGKCQDCYFCRKAPNVCSGGASCIAYAVYKDPFQPDPQCPYTPDVGSGVFQMFGH